MKKPEILLKEYVRRLSDSDLSDLRRWYSGNYPGDRSNIANLYSSDKEMDKWLSSACSAQEWFDMIDMASEYIDREHQWRSTERNERRKKKERSRREETSNA